MRNLLARRECDRVLPHAFLHSVWYVDADHTYHVFKTNGAESQYVAVRTLTGQGDMHLSDGSHFVLPGGSLGLFRSQDIRQYDASKGGWQFYWFAFDMLSLSMPVNCICQPPMSTLERAELERCFMCLSSGMELDCAVAEALFNYRLADWLRRMDSNAQGHPLSGDIIALLEKGRRERMSVADMARTAGMCERSFRDAVHAATGLSPKAYMLKGEMTAAMELLRTTSMTISEISACFQYTSPFYFSRVFKKYYGLSPQQVRNSIQL